MKRRGRNVGSTSSAVISNSPDSGDNHGKHKDRAFVTLAYAELREIFFRKASEIRKMSPIDLGLPAYDFEGIQFFEVLVPGKHDLFIKMREEGLRLGIYKLCHCGGTIFARKTNSSSA